MSNVLYDSRKSIAPTIYLYSPGGLNFKAYMKEPFSSAFTAKYTSQMDQMAQLGISALGEKVGKAVSSLGKLSDMFGATFGMKANNLWMTKQSWIDSTTGDISFSCRIVTTDSSVNTVEQVKSLLAAVLPTVGESNTTITAPLGYAPVTNEERAISVHIPGYFKTTATHLCTSVAPTFSQIKVKGTDRPYYVDISVSLTPKMMFNRQEIEAWFIGG